MLTKRSSPPLILTLLAVTMLAPTPARAQEESRRWISGDRAMLRQPDSGLDAYCKETIPVEAANGLHAPAGPAEFRAWLQRLKVEKPAIAKCYDPGVPVMKGAGATLLDSNAGCSSTFLRVRLDDGRVGCVNNEFLTEKHP